MARDSEILQLNEQTPEITSELEHDDTGPQDVEAETTTGPTQEEMEAAAASLLQNFTYSSDATPDGLARLQQQLSSLSFFERLQDSSPNYRQMLERLSAIIRLNDRPIGAEIRVELSGWNDVLMTGYNALLMAANLCVTELDEADGALKKEQHRLACHVQALSTQIYQQLAATMDEAGQYLNEQQHPEATTWGALVAHSMSKQAIPQPPATQEGEHDAENTQAPVETPPAEETKGPLTVFQERLLQATPEPPETTPLYAAVFAALDTLRLFLATGAAVAMGDDAVKRGPQLCRQLIATLDAYCTPARTQEEALADASGEAATGSQAGAPPKETESTERSPRLNIMQELLGEASAQLTEMTVQEPAMQTLVGQLPTSPALAAKTWGELWAYSKAHDAAPETDDIGERTETAPETRLVFAPIRTGEPATDELPELLDSLRKTSLTREDETGQYNELLLALSELVYANGRKVSDTSDGTPEQRLDWMNRRYTRLKNAAQDSSAAEPESDAPLPLQTRREVAARLLVVAIDQLDEMADLYALALEHLAWLDEVKETAPDEAARVWGNFWAYCRTVLKPQVEFGAADKYSTKTDTGIKELMAFQAALNAFGRLHRRASVLKTISETLDAIQKRYLDTIPDDTETSKALYLELIGLFDKLIDASRDYLSTSSTRSAAARERHRIMDEALQQIVNLNLHINALRSTAFTYLDELNSLQDTARLPWRNFFLVVDKYYRPRNQIILSKKDSRAVITAQMLEMLESATEGGLGFNANVYRRLMDTLRNIASLRSKDFSGEYSADLRQLMSMDGLYQTLLEDTRFYIATPNGGGPQAQKRKDIVRQLRPLAVQDHEQLKKARDYVLNAPQGEKPAPKWDEIFAGDTLQTVPLEQAQAGGATFVPEEKIELAEEHTLLEYIKLAKARRIALLKEAEDKHGLVALLESIPTLLVIEANSPQELADYILNLEQEQQDELWRVLDEIKKEGSHAFEAAKPMRKVGLHSGKTLNTSNRSVAVARLAHMLGLGHLVRSAQRVALEEEEPLESTSGRRIGALHQKPEGRQISKLRTQRRGQLQSGALSRIATSTLRQELVCLQMFDALCGQAKRAPETLFFKTDDNGMLTGLTVAAGSQSFGTDTGLMKGSQMQELFLYNLSLNAREKQQKKEEAGAKPIPIISDLSLPYYDRTLARRIIEMDEAEVRFALDDLLEDAEVNAFITRLRRMQAAFSRSMGNSRYSRRFLSEEQWDNARHEPMLKVAYYSSLSAALTPRRAPGPRRTPATT